MTTELLSDIEDAIREIAARNGVRLERIVFFGSRTRDEATETSDIDFVLVSVDWEGVPYKDRPRPFYTAWPYAELPEPDIHPLTPDEYTDRADDEGRLTHTAVTEGVDV